MVKNRVKELFGNFNKIMYTKENGNRDRDMDLVFNGQEEE